MRLNTLQDVLAYRLGAALTMERDSLSMLEKLRQAAISSEARELFTHHAEETEDQITNLRQVFGLLGLAEKEKPSPTTKGLGDESASLIEKVGPDLRDAIALSAAACTEHFEIASYRSLVSLTGALKQRDAVELLTENLRQEEHTAKELEQLAKQVVSHLATTDAAVAS